MTDESPTPAPLELVAYRMEQPYSMPIIPASEMRHWATQGQQSGEANEAAVQRLPMTLANRSGWFLLNPYRLEAQWRARNSQLHIRYLEPIPDPDHGPAKHKFVGPILTWSTPYIFRTPSGYSLWTRGPANHFKHGAQPMEGVVETDWAYMPFPINWVLTTEEPVIFEKYEPVSMIFPIKRGSIEVLQPRLDEIEHAPRAEATQDSAAHWSVPSFNPEWDGLADAFTQPRQE